MIRLRGDASDRRAAARRTPGADHGALDDGWKAAMAGCDEVHHVASPMPYVPPKDPDDLIVPAREGTLRAAETTIVESAESLRDLGLLEGQR